jgi:hypothetical protein
MGNDLFGMIERFEIIVFFAGYTILYCLLNYLWIKPYLFIEKLKSVLPLGYALSSTLFLGYFLRKIYQNHILGNAELQFYHPFLIAWGMMALFFWFPFFRKSPSLSLMHSFMFLFYILSDLVISLFGDKDILVIRNNMNILTASFLINVTTLFVVFFIFSLINKFKKTF